MIKKLFAKYKSMSLPVKMAFWFLVCSFLQKGIGMICTPLFTRIMTESEYGRYSIYTSWYSIISVFVTLSISGNCYTRALVVYEGDQKKQNELQSSLLGLTTTLIVFFAILYLPLRTIINKYTGLTDYLYLMMAVDFLLISACQFWTNTKRVKYEYKAIVFVTLTFTVLRPLISTFAVLYCPETIQVEARVTGIAIANALLFIALFISIFLKGKKFFVWEHWKYALTFCIPLIPHYLSKTILNQSDRIMIGQICSNTEAGYYSVAYTIAGIMLILNSAIAQSLDPWIYRSIKNKKLDRIGPVSYRITAVIALINFVVMAIAPEVLSVLAPANYSKALMVIPPVTASVFFTFMYDLFASFQFYFKKTKWIAIGSCAGALLNIGLNAVFIPIFGFVAAGYTTLVCYILFGVMHYAFMRRISKQYLDGYRVYDGKIIFGIGLLLIGLSFVMILLYNHSVIRYILLAMILIGMIIKRKAIISLLKAVKKD